MVGGEEDHRVFHEAITGELVEEPADLSVEDANHRFVGAACSPDSIRLVVNRPDGDTAQPEAAAIPQEVLTAVEGATGFTVTAGVGTSVSSLPDVGESPRAAERDLDRKMLVGKNRVIISETVLRSDEGVFVIPLIEMERIGNRLKAGDLAGVERSLDVRFGRLRSTARWQSRMFGTCSSSCSA